MARDTDNISVIDGETKEWHDTSGIEHLREFWDEPWWVLRDLPHNLILARKEILKQIEEDFAQLEAENEALRKGHWRQLADTDYCYVCDGHGHHHADDCVLTGGDDAS